MSRAGVIDVIVVYKVDRLSRSLTDFGSFLPLECRIGIADDPAAVAALCYRRTIRRSSR